MKPDIIHIAALEAKDARIKELEDWKDSAMTVLGQWYDLVKSLPKDFVDQPKFLEASQSTAVGAYISELKQSDVSVCSEQQYRDHEIKVGLRRLVSEKDAELVEAQAKSWGLKARIKELEEALEESLALNINVFSNADAETCSYYSEHRTVIKQAKAALRKDNS